MRYSQRGSLGAGGLGCTGILDIRDTLRCVELSILHPPRAGEYRTFNQFTEMFNVLGLAELVKQQAEELGLSVQIEHLENTRVEAEAHYYNPRHQKLIDLGLVPQVLSDVLLKSMISRVQEHAHRIKPDIIPPQVRGGRTRAAEEQRPAALAGSSSRKSSRDS